MSRASSHIVIAIALSAVLTASANAGQSLMLTPGVQGTYVVPAASPFLALGDTRMEIRLHNFQPCNENYSNIWDFGSIQVRCHVAGGNEIAVMDTVVGVGSVIPMANRNDVILRIQRNLASGQLYTEIWNANGSGYELFTRTGASTIASNVSGAKYVGGPATTVQVALVRWFSTTIPLGGAPLSAGQPDLAEWKLDGNGAETLSRMPLAINASYAQTVVYPPVPIALLAGASPSDLPVVRAGSRAVLDGTRSYSLIDEQALTYRWVQVGSLPSKLVWSDRTAASPSVSGIVAGQYLLSLTTRDAAGNESSTNLTLGAVATDHQGLVIHRDPETDILFSPMLRFGLSLWPWGDTQHVRYADGLMLLQSQDSQYDAVDWQTPLPGTMSVTRDSAVIQGSGTNFQNEFCNGGTTPSGAWLVIWYPRADGSAGKQLYVVRSCQSATELTLEGQYNSSNSTQGVRYSKMICPGCWIGGSDNVNYYDNVLAFYALYYKTGLTKYRDFARTLAQRWWIQPAIDEGFCVDQRSCLGAPRQLGLLGLMWWLHETGQDDKWVGLRKLLDQHVNYLVTDPWQDRPPSDLRENSYVVVFAAAASRWDPDPTRRTYYRDAVINAINRSWEPSRKSTSNVKGIWEILTLDLSSWNGYPGTVTVTKGSNIVVGTGTNWDNSWGICGAERPWFYVASVTGEDGDAEAYHCTWVSTTEVRLTEPYKGASRQGAGWQFTNLAGVGAQPFFHGLASTLWALTYRMTGIDQAREYSVDLGEYVRSFGIQTSVGGLYYGRGHPNCEQYGSPPADALSPCAADPADQYQVWAARFLNGEVLRGLAYSYVYSNQDSAFASSADYLMGKALGKDGGPQSDGIYAKELEEVCTANAECRKPKDFGFYWGIGGSWAWPAARVGSITPPVETAFFTVAHSDTVPGTATVRGIVTQPNGTATTVSCSSTLCVVPVDTRQGTHRFRREYLSADNTVLHAVEIDLVVGSAN